MSRKTQKSDPRIARTRDRLGDALVELMLEKEFDSISVQDVLDRAGISRSTFYVHYRDKEDLFMSDVDDFWSAMSSMLSRAAEQSDRLAPVRELFTHVAESRDFMSALVHSGRVHDVIELGRLHFARGIEQRLAEVPRGRKISRDKRAAAAHALAGSLTSLLAWWLDARSPLTAAKMDDLFHEIAWNGLLGNGDNYVT